MIHLDLNKVSDSRVFFLGALAATTVGAGSLAQLLFDPARFAVWPVSKIVSVALALTLPIILFAAFVVFTAMREKMPSDEKARRAITVGCAVSGLSQLAVLAMGYNGALSIRDYLAWTSALSIFLAAIVFLMARVALGSRLRDRQARRRRRQADRRVQLLAGQLQ